MYMRTLSVVYIESIDEFIVGDNIKDLQKVRTLKYNSYITDDGCVLAYAHNHLQWIYTLYTSVIC